MTTGAGSSQLAVRSWRPAVVVAPVFGFVCGGFGFSNVIAAIAGAALTFAGLVLLGGASTIEVDTSGISLTRLGRTRRIDWVDATEVVCWVRQPWGGRVPPLSVEVTATTAASPRIAFPVTLRVDMIRRRTAEQGAQTIQEWATKAGIPATVKPWG